MSASSSHNLQVVKALSVTGHAVEAWRLSLVLKSSAFPDVTAAATRSGLQRAAALLLLGKTEELTAVGGHALSVLTATSCLWSRAALMKMVLLLILEEEDKLKTTVKNTAPPTMLMSDIYRIYGKNMRSKLDGALKYYRARIAAAAAAFGGSCNDDDDDDDNSNNNKHRKRHEVEDGGRGPFTFQIARHEVQNGKRKKKGGDMTEQECEAGIIRRMFVTFVDTDSTLQFLEAWYAAQMASSNDAMTCLFECGPHDGTWRKWVLDIDASTADLAKLNLPAAEDKLFPLVLKMASAVARGLHLLGFLKEPCHFAITSRHSPQKKFSWHVVLCALASHEEWRHAIRAMEKFYLVGCGRDGSAAAAAAAAAEDDDEWKMYRLVDPAILRNSRGQYIQVCVLILCL